MTGESTARSNGSAVPCPANSTPSTTTTIAQPASRPPARRRAWSASKDRPDQGRIPLLDEKFRHSIRAARSDGALAGYTGARAGRTGGGRRGTVSISRPGGLALVLGLDQQVDERAAVLGELGRVTGVVDRGRDDRYRVGTVVQDAYRFLRDRVGPGLELGPGEARELQRDQLA